jgi:hypothetical protein
MIITFIDPLYQFQPSDFSKFEKQRGLVSIRISNGTKWEEMGTCYLQWTFNKVKYINAALEIFCAARAIEIIVI